MVNARLCETARLAFFFASPRHFDFLDCETETSKCFECERETFRLLKFEPQIWFRAMRRYDNELELACTKVLRRRLLLSTVNKLYYFPGHDLISGQEVTLGRLPLIFL